MPTPGTSRLREGKVEDSFPLPLAGGVGGGHSNALPQKNKIPPIATASLSALLPECARDLEWMYSPISVTQLVRP